MPAINEVSAAEFEQELRGGTPIAVLDVRPEDDVARWPLDGGGARVVAVPRTNLSSALAALLPENRPVRVICSRGNASRIAVAELAQLGIAATSVTGGMTAWGRLLVAEEVETGTRATVVQFRREARGCLSYLVSEGGSALVVDPAPDPSAYVREAERLGVRIEAILDTHVHADHVSGARALQAETGATLHLSRGALARGVAYATPVEDGDSIGPAGAGARVLALPGHTTDNVGVLIEASALIAGDSLFCETVARPELESGPEHAGAAARTLHRTLRRRILSLPAETILLPCHYAGGRRAHAERTTLGAAVEANPLLSAGEQEFVAAVLRDLPARPANYETIIAVNLGYEGVDDPAALEVGTNNCAAGLAAR